MAIANLSLKDLLEWYGDDPNIAGHWVKLDADAKIPAMQLPLFSSGNSNFDGPEGVTIVHYCNPGIYSPIVTPITADGCIGEICVSEQTVSSFCVKNSGQSGVPFEWAIQAPSKSQTGEGTNPILTVGPPGAFDVAGVAGGDIISIDSLFYMFYSALNNSSSWSIGLATSPNLIVWTKHASNPILSPTEPWEGNQVIVAAILRDLETVPLKHNGKYWMAYGGNNNTSTGFAYADHIEGPWTKHAMNPFLSPDVGEWDESVVRPFSFVKEDTTFYIFYGGCDNELKWQVGYATASSPDGIWTKHASNPILSPTEPWEGQLVNDPLIKKFDTQYYLFFTGREAAGKNENGYAIADSIGGPYIKYVNNPITETIPDTWDERMTYALVVKMGCGFYMVYDGHQDIVPLHQKGLVWATNINGPWTKLSTG